MENKDGKGLKPIKVEKTGFADEFLTRNKTTSNVKECGVTLSMRIKPNEISYDTGLWM